MARISVCGWESGVLLEFPDQGTLGTAPTVITSSPTPRTGTYCMKATSASGTNSLIWKDYLTDPTSISFSAAFYITTAPNTEDNIVMWERLSDLRDIIRVKLGSDRRLRIVTQVSGSDVQIGNYSTAVSASAWHTLQVRWIAGDGNGVVYAKVDTEEFCAVTNASIGTAGVRTTYFGIGSLHTNTPNIAWDDWVEDNSGSAYLGEAKIQVAVPNAAGTYSTPWSTKVGSFTNDWDGVAEVPASDTLGWYETGTSAPAFTFNVENASTAGLGSTDNIRCVALKVKSKAGTGTIGTTKIRLREGSTDTDTNITLTTTSKWFEVFHTSAPSTSSPWTQSGFDGVQIGMVANNNSADTYMYEALVMVEYLVPTTTPQTVTSKVLTTYTGVPVKISPTNSSNQSNTLTLIWTIPANSFNRPIYSRVEIDNDSGFGSKEKDLYSNIEGNFEYWNGSEWATYPRSGVTSTYYGNQARVSVTLTGTETKYWRVTCGA